MTAAALSALALWIAAANVVAFLAFGLDKQLAIADARRIPESTLLSIALLGGSAGAVAGQQFFRHKTQKEPFRTRLYGIVALQAVGVAAVVARPELLTTLLR